jgi:hypothetical protein
MRYVSAIVTLAVGLAGAAYAANVHFKSGPSFVDNGLTLTAQGVLAGLGFQNLVVNLTATANPTATCTNHGQHQPAGQNPAPVSVSANPDAIPAPAIKNGNAAFSLITNAPTSPIPGAPDCPNSNWTEVITDLAFTSAIITIEQPPGTVVRTVSCTFAPPTVNGPVNKQTVTCN